MKDITVANRYADAIYAEAKATNSVDGVLADLQNLGRLMLENKDFAVMATTAALTADDKMSVINKIGQSGMVGRLVYGLLVVLVRNKRLDLLDVIIEAVEDKVREERGEVEVTVNYAVPVTDAVRADLVARLTSITNKKVILKETIEPALLGGMKIWVGSTMYDASVKGRLDALKNRLTR